MDENKKTLIADEIERQQTEDVMAPLTDRVSCGDDATAKTCRPGHKAGFVNIVGNPNVGKSTLMNDLVGERISIITSKAQTTRHRITGIVNTPDYQIVFSDTPGVLKPNYKLQESMLAFSQGALTDKPARFFVTEIIREKILTAYDKEIPYSVEVIVEKFDESEKSIHIMATIFVERDSQKGIIIGRGGQMLKRIGTEARKDIEKFFDKRVYLELFVKVEPNWRNRENKLKSFGYIE